MYKVLFDLILNKINYIYIVINLYYLIESLLNDNRLESFTLFRWGVPYARGKETSSQLK